MLKNTFLFVFILSANCALAQVGKVGINTTMPQAMFHVKDSSVLFTGTALLPMNAGNPPVSGAGTRMMWYPGKAAFRVGNVSGTQWNKDSIGTYSFAAGRNTRAIGEHSFAMGFNSRASGATSMAVGFNAVASGGGGIALGVGAAASNVSSVAIGENAKSAGIYSVAIGFYADARGYASHAFGVDALAKGTAASAHGAHTQANGAASTVVGIYNDTIVGQQSLVNSNTPLFVVGNGDDFDERSNAITILKNGNIGLKTTAPKSKLHVTGGTDASYSGTSGYVILGEVDDPNIVFDNDEIIARDGTAAADLFLQHQSPGGDLIVCGGGGNLGVGISTPAKKLHVYTGASGAVANGSANAVFEGSGTTFINILTPNNQQNGILFGNVASSAHGGIVYNNPSTPNGMQFRTNGNSNKMVITSGGDVGIGTTSPSERLHVFNGFSGGTSFPGTDLVIEDDASAYISLLSPDDSFTGILFGTTTSSNISSIQYWDLLGTLSFQVAGTQKMTITSAGNVGIGTSGPGYLLEVDGAAAKPGGGSWTSSSDKRLKQHITDYTEGLAEVLAIHPVSYQYNKLSTYKTDKTYIGVIAQELREIAPYMVAESQKEMTDGSSGYLEVDNSAMTYMLINAVKELSAQLDAQKEQIVLLQSQLQQLQKSTNHE